MNKKKIVNILLQMLFIFVGCFITYMLITSENIVERARYVIYGYFLMILVVVMVFINANE